MCSNAVQDLAANLSLSTGEAQGKKQWTDTDTLVLLRVWGSENMQSKMIKARHKRKLWTEISQELTRRGVARDWQQCFYKIHNMSVEHQKIRTGRRQGKSYFKFFELFDEIIKKRETTVRQMTEKRKWNSQTSSSHRETNVLTRNMTVDELGRRQDQENESQEPAPELEAFFDEQQLAAVQDTISTAQKAGSSTTSSSSSNENGEILADVDGRQSKTDSAIASGFESPSDKRECKDVQKLSCFNLSFRGNSNITAMQVDQPPIVDNCSQNDGRSNTKTTKDHQQLLQQQQNAFLTSLSLILEKTKEMQRDSEERFYQFEEKRMRLQFEYEEIRHKRAMEQDKQRNDFQAQLINSVVKAYLDRSIISEQNLLAQNLTDGLECAGQSLNGL